MGIGGDILKGIVKEATRDITKEFDEKMSESIKAVSYTHLTLPTNREV